jgi:peptidoglycan/LPS O-acetylase OafA/YrhL
MTRDPGLDGARVLAMALVIVTHAAIAYMVTPVGWALQDRSQFLGVDLWVWIIRAFVMPTFFWLSGYFARVTLEMHGVRGYVRQRLTRVAVPLVIALVPVSLAVDALWDWGRAVELRGVVADNVPKLTASELPVQLGHLWFLYYLVWFSAAALVARLVRVRVPAAAAIAIAAIGIPAGVLVGMRVVHTDTPLGFVPDPAILVHMGAYFAWGWLAHARPGELARYARWLGGALAIAALALGIVLVTLYRGLTEVAAPPVYASAASGVFSAAMIVIVLGACMRFVTRTTPAMRAAADASYWVYIVHLPVVVLLQIVAAPLPLPWFAKLPAIAAIAAAVSFGVYAVGRRLRNRSRR